MKKCLLLTLVFSCLLVIPQQIKAQSYEDYYNAGYIIGASIRQAVDNSRARKAEQERREMERLEAERRYELEQQRIANERYAIQQREAEARRAEEERLRIANEAKKAEEERLRLAEEARRAEEERLKLLSSGGTGQINNAANENREYNKNAQILSSNNTASFLSDEGKSIYLYVLDDTNGGTYLSFYNHDDNERRFVCNKVSIKLKYVGDDVEQIITDACSFSMPARTSSILDWSDIFFNVSDTRAVESIRIQFVDTQIR